MAMNYCRQLERRGLGGYRISFDDPPTITCFCCGSVSANLDDIDQHYCATCHKFHDLYLPDNPYAGPQLRRKLLGG
jgi:hypothetical protein